jgi:hypothetical protein
VSKQVPWNKGKGETLRWMHEHVAYDGDKCLRWPFSYNWNGYGHIGVNRAVIKAHRFMCILAHGEPPTPKHQAAHSCNNGHMGCVNPKHLSWKTPRQNALDRRAAGTLTKRRWTKYGAVSQEHMAQIVALRGQKNQREIAAQFGISPQHVSTIQLGRLKRQQSGSHSSHMRGNEK